MDEHDLFDSFDSSGELKQLLRTRKWIGVVDLCEKRLKRSDAQNALRVCKATALLLDKRPGKKALGKAQLDELLDKSGSVIDATGLLLLEGVVRATHGDSGLTGKLEANWDRAATSTKQDNDWVYRAWLETKLRKGLYHDAKHATMAWMKAFPMEHEPFYFFILVNHVISRSRHTSTTDQRLCQMLASKALATASANTVSENGNQVKMNGRRLTSKEDLLLLLRLYVDQGKYDESLEILADVRQGFASPIGKGAWELATQMIRIQGLSGKWELQWNTCHQILTGARSQKSDRSSPVSTLAFGDRGDDWKIWDALVVAACKMYPLKADLMSKTNLLIDAFSGPKSRNASLASIKLACQAGAHGSRLPMRHQRFQTYFEVYASSTACFQDLRPHLAWLPRDGQEALVKQITQMGKTDRVVQSSSKILHAKRIVSEINSLKIDYHLIVSRKTQYDQLNVITGFVNTCLKLYKASILLDLQLPQSDRGSADDAAILAAASLLQLYAAGHKKALLQSIIILEFLLTHSKHNYDALLILTRLYAHLGAGSLAMDRYSRLSIKNIQHASISWILFTRLSTVHPWASSGPDGVTFDPLKEIRRALEWHRNAARQTDKALHRMVANKQWAMILGMLETQTALQNGYGRMLLAVEYQRLRRFRPPAQDDRRYSALGVSPPLKDNRDRSAFPNYQPNNHENLEKLLPNVVPLFGPGVKWFVRELRLANLWDRMGGLPRNPLDDERLAKLVEQSLVEGGASLTVSETMVDHMIALLPVASSVPESIPSAALDVGEILERLSKLEKEIQCLLNSSGRAGPQSALGVIHFGNANYLPNWSTFHHNYCLIEISIFVRRCMGNIKVRDASITSSERLDIAEKVATIEQSCDLLLADINSVATRWKAWISGFKPEALVSSGMNGEVDAEHQDIPVELRSIVGEEMVSSISAMLQESLLEAFDGVLRSSAL